VWRVSRLFMGDDNDDNGWGVNTKARLLDVGDRRACLGLRSCYGYGRSGGGASGSHPTRVIARDNIDRAQAHNLLASRTRVARRLLSSRPDQICSFQIQRAGYCRLRFAVPNHMKGACR